MKTIKLALQEATEKLSLSSESPALDAEILLAYILDKTRTHLATWPEKELSTEQHLAFAALIERRADGEPIAYIVEQQGFWSLDLKTLPHTLIPRPDTETLVEWVLDLAEQLPDNSMVIDLGTGTGAIALAIAKEFPAWQVQGCDRVEEAVALAQQNAALNHLPGVNFYTSNWYSDVSGRFDLIVSNPPYIDPQDHHLRQGDVRFEPLSALIAENQGLADLAHIIDQAPDFLNDKGWLLVEHGYDQQAAVQQLFSQRGYQQVATRKDLGGNPRITAGQFSHVDNE